METMPAIMLGVPFGADAERAAGRGAAEIVLRHVVLERAEQHIGDALGDRDQRGACRRCGPCRVSAVQPW